MRYYINIEKEPSTIELTVRTKTPEVIVIKCKDFDRPIIYIDRYKKIDGTCTFFLKMPQTPRTLCIEVYNKKNGDMPYGKDTSFECTENDLVISKLDIKVDVSFVSIPRVQNFIKFAQRFSEIANILPSGQLVKSNCGQYTIEIVDYIPNQTNTANSKSPYMIEASGKIYCAKMMIRDYTVYMNMALLLHEFSHVYINSKANNEIEADLNSLLCFLGLGYPKIEARKAFLKVFETSQDNKANSQRNLYYKLRDEKISNFIDNFDSIDFKIL